MTRVVIIGGGLAGLSAAATLAPRGFDVQLLEARHRLGGRAGSFHDPQTDQWIDACQHVTMGCCTRFAAFCRTFGIDRFLERQPRLYFMTPDRRVSVMSADPLPAPLHLARAFARAHYVSFADKCRIARALTSLRRPREDDPPFLDWLLDQGQSRTAIDRFWGIIITSALNEDVGRVGFRYARKVFVDGFLAGRSAFEVHIPNVPLARLYGDELRAWLERHRVRVSHNAAVKHVHCDGERVLGLELRSGATLDFDAVICAVPHGRLLEILPDAVINRHGCFQALRKLEVSPITSVHLWYERPILPWPHVVLIDCLGQWAFQREQGYVQVVISSARSVKPLGHDEIRDRIVMELAGLFPDAGAVRLLRSRVVTEHAATFGALPNVDELRPPQVTPLSNLFLAGDWTRTGWPATMEGAVTSGELAGQALIAANLPVSAVSQGEA